MKRFLGVEVGRKPTWDDLRGRIELALGQVPEGEVVRLDERQPILHWRDGPGESTVADAVGEVTGWSWSLWQPEPDEEASTVWLDRAFTVDALAVAVVRYRSSHTIPYDSDHDGARAGLREILDTDGPARSGFPLADAIAEALLAAPDPDADLDAPTGADRLSRKLEALGFERLWAEAYATTDL